MGVKAANSLYSGAITPCLVLAGLIGGCGVGPPAAPSDSPNVVDEKTHGEPNSSFSEAIEAVFDSDGVGKLQGVVEDAGDLDVFSMGAMSGGDRIIVDADTSDSMLDVSVAIFDDQERLVVENDDRQEPGNRYLDSYIDWIVRHDSENHYLVVTDAAFAASNQHSGSYSINIQVIAGTEIPEPVNQLIMLDFDGGTVNSPGLGNVTIVPFDAGLIDDVYRGYTEEMKETIRATVEQNFERFGAVIITSDDSPPADDVLYSTVFFGGYDYNAFGLAESVDSYNQDYCDDAIIYTESFGLQMFSFVPTVEEMGIAIGNVAAHEAGHLLGLNHVDEDAALMDDRSSADVFVTDQEFMEAPLSSDIMPIGFQDAVLLLSEIVGYFG